MRNNLFKKYVEHEDIEGKWEEQYFVHLIGGSNELKSETINTEKCIHGIC